MRQPHRNALFSDGTMQHLLADLIDTLVGRPEQICVLQEQYMRLERVRAGLFRDDLAEQAADGLEQHEAIPVSGGRSVLLQRLRDGGKPRLDFTESQCGRRRSHAVRKKSSSVRVNSAGASACGSRATR